MALSTHRIRLQGPWEWSPLTTDGANWSKVSLPDEWGQLPAMSSAVAFRRRFHTPTGIKPLDQVFIVVTTHGTVSKLFLNEQRLTVVDALPIYRAEVTPLLSGHNQLVIVLPLVDPDRPAEGLGSPVVLEIVSRSPE